MIIHKGQNVNNFFIVVRGQVEVVLENSKRPEVTLGQLGPGEFFGEIELIHGGDSLASVRAAPDDPVELVALPHKDFAEMLVGSPLTEEALSRIVQARLAQNRSVDRRTGWW
jgi:CRP-like cAMP-binding protein